MFRLQQGAPQPPPPQSKYAIIQTIYYDPFNWAVCKGLIGFIGGVFLARSDTEAFSMFEGFFLLLSIVAGSLFIYTKTRVERNDDPVFVSLQRSYVAVYVLAVAGDWLQGPHVYALYQSYGMSKHQIEVLFIAGFGSSLLFGTFIGSIADKFGRRWNCVLYGILYGASCITKHVPLLRVLMVGRFLGGIATSILYSAFESWLLHEHTKRGLSEQSLGTILSNAAVMNSVVAIVAGVVAQFAADRFGYVAPFDFAFVSLALMVILVWKTWPENYGNEAAPINQSFFKSAQLIASDRRVQCLGAVQALFEGTMYTFVLEWTPALSQAADIGSALPHGLIFSCFMLSTMIGSSLFKVFSRLSSIEDIMRYVLITSTLCFLVPLCAPFSLPLVFISFVVFEICVGVFWPCMACLRSEYLPEDTRSTTINLFRIPLNLIVILVLLQNLSMHTIFQFCVFFLLVASSAQHYLYRLSLCGGSKESQVSIETGRVDFSLTLPSKP